MKNKITPILFENKILKEVFSEIIRNINNANSIEFKIIEEDFLKNLNADLLITDNLKFKERIINKSKLTKIFLIVERLTNIDTSDLSFDVTQVKYPIKIAEFINMIQESILYQKGSNEKKVSFNDFVFDPGSRILSNKFNSIRFTEKESEIFSTLMNDRKKGMNKKELLKIVWKYSEEIDTHTLETHIYSLRKKIEKKFNIKNLIDYEEKKGYFFNKETL